MDPEPTLFPLPVIRDEPLRPRARRPFLAVLLHLARLGIFVGVLLLVRLQHQRFLAHEAAKDHEPVGVDILRECFPTAAGVHETFGAGGGGLPFDPKYNTAQVVDSSEHVLGFVVQTSPEADHIVGFSGPTNILIAFGPDDQIRCLQILWSRDTREHVNLIEREGEFINAWNGRSWSEAADLTSVDSVSGATLTSLAIAQSIATRLGGSAPSLKFPDAVFMNDVRAWFPDAISLSSDPRRPALLQVLAEDDSLLGYVFHTSPAADNLIGYQGPTNTFVVLDTQEKVLGIRLHGSYDNRPYVIYVEDDDYFLTLFNNYSLSELAELDLFKEGVEGVSGATMTSMTVADALVLAARHVATEVEPPPTDTTRYSLSGRQLATAGIVLAGLIIGFTQLRRFKVLRLILLMGVIGVVGILNGDMLSMAVVFGWAQNGIPWSIATGLVFISAIAFIVPAMSKQQVYCHQLCPHGAVQQLIKKRLPWQWVAPDWLRRGLPLLPFALLVWCVIVGMLQLPFSLVGLEPFDAWVFQAAGAATITIAVLGLLASLFVPMAYCRYGCPTGAVLNYLRFNSRSDVWTRTDWLASVLLVLAVALSQLVPTGSLDIDDALAASAYIQNWISDNHVPLRWLTLLSSVLFVGSLFAVPWLISRIPVDYFVRPPAERSGFQHRHPAVIVAGRTLKNLLGSVLVLAGIAMLVLPGQGLLTIFLGIMLIDFPGKRRLEFLIIRRRSIRRAIGWIRRRTGQDELQLPS
jgi:Na+-translocating ferredoxin:NAD+ oxidoreductase RnfG subunit